MIVGCYDLDLYCDKKENCFGDEFPHQYQGYDRSNARKKARCEGWILHRDGDATCPACSGKEPKRYEPETELERIVDEAESVSHLEIMNDQ